MFQDLRKYLLQIPRLYFSWDSHSGTGNVTIFSLNIVRIIRFGMNGAFTEQNVPFNLLKDSFKDKLNLDLKYHSSTQGFYRIPYSDALENFVEPLGNNYNNFALAFKAGNGKFFTDKFWETFWKSQTDEDYSGITFRMTMNLNTYYRLVVNFCF